MIPQHWSGWKGQIAPPSVRGQSTQSVHTFRRILRGLPPRPEQRYCRHHMPACFCMCKLCVRGCLSHKHAPAHTLTACLFLSAHVARQRYQLVVFVRVNARQHFSKAQFSSAMPSPPGLLSPPPQWISKCGSKMKLQLTRHRNAPSTSILLCPSTVAWCAGAWDTAARGCAARGCAGLGAGGGDSGKRGLARLMTLCNDVAVAAFSSTGCAVAATCLGDLPHTSHLRGRKLVITPYSIRSRSKVQGRDNLQILLSPSRRPAAIMLTDPG